MRVLSFIAATALAVAPSAWAYQYDQTCDGELQITRYTTSTRDVEYSGFGFPPLPLTQGTSVVGQPFQPGTVSQSFDLPIGYYTLEVRTFVCASLEVVGGSLVAFEGSCDFEVTSADGTSECKLFLIDQEELGQQTLSGEFLPQISSLSVSPTLVALGDGLENNSTVTVHGYDMDSDAKAGNGWWYNFEVTDENGDSDNTEGKFRQLSYSAFHDNVGDDAARTTNFNACQNQEVCEAHLQPEDTATGSVFFKISQFDNDGNEVFVTGSIGVDGMRTQGVSLMMLNKPFVCLDSSVVMCRTDDLGPRIVSPASVVNANVNAASGVINGGGDALGHSNTVYMEDLSYTTFATEIVADVIEIQIAVKDTDLQYTLDGKTDRVKLSTVTIAEEYSTLPANSDGRKTPGCGEIVGFDNGDYGYGQGTEIANDPKDTMLFKVKWKPFSSSDPDTTYDGPDKYLESRCRLTIQAEDESADHNGVAENFKSNTIVKEFVVGGKRAMNDLETYKGVPVIAAFLQGNDEPVVSTASCTLKSEHTETDLSGISTGTIAQTYCSETCSQVIFNHEGPNQSDRRFTATIELTDTSDASKQATLISSYFSDWTEDATAAVGTKYSRNFEQDDFYTLTEAYQNFCIKVGEEDAKTITATFTLQNTDKVGTDEQKLEFSYTWLTVAQVTDVGVGDINSNDGLTTAITAAPTTTTTTTVVPGGTNAPFDSSAASTITAQTTLAALTAPGGRRMRRRVNDEYFSSKSKDLAFRTRRQSAIKLNSGVSIRVDGGEVVVTADGTAASQVFGTDPPENTTVYDDARHNVEIKHLTDLLNSFMNSFNNTDTLPATALETMVQEFIEASHKDVDAIESAVAMLSDLTDGANNMTALDNRLKELGVAVDSSANTSRVTAANFAANIDQLHKLTELEEQIKTELDDVDHKTNTISTTVGAISTTVDAISSTVGALSGAVIDDISGKLPDKNFTSHLTTILGKHEQAAAKYEEIIDLVGQQCGAESPPSGHADDLMEQKMTKMMLDILKAVEVIQAQLSNEHKILEHHILGGNEEDKLIGKMNDRLDQVIGQLAAVTDADSASEAEAKINAQINAIKAFQHDLQDSESSGVLCQGSSDLTETAEGKVIISVLALSSFVALSVLSVGAYMLMKRMNNGYSQIVGSYS